MLFDLYSDQYIYEEIKQQSAPYFTIETNDKKKRAKKIPVPDHLKDAKYWARRAKNNESARKTRKKKKMHILQQQEKTFGRSSIHQKCKLMKQKLDTLLDENKNLHATIEELEATKSYLIKQVRQTYLSAQPS
jgi:thiamine kinase-like enzyme